MNSKAHKLGLALLAGGFALAGAAVAQQMNEIVVESAPPHVEHVMGSAASAVHYDLISVKFAVSYSDLDLSTHSGATELERRVNAAAKKGCAEIDRLYPLAPEASNDRPCVKNAVDNAMVTAREVISAAESKAKH